ncbi:MAG TPA: DUF302 domain-containing protein [Prolixibacteraceae bacterium]|nr:DUF302 domain-containing protein [Prolixibacteraceae bacterium]HPS12007.1 DUF302 domain-containing protein [Prolixibacteraceae bacterium]
MEIYLSKTLGNTNFADAESRVIDKLKEQGFGVITEIDVQATFKAKLNVDFKPYKILGACNPHFAHSVLSKNDKIGVMLPCNVCLQQISENSVEVFTINPLEAMKAMNDQGAEELAGQVYTKLSAMLQSL